MQEHVGFHKDSLVSLHPSRTLIVGISPAVAPQAGERFVSRYRKSLREATESSEAGTNLCQEQRGKNGERIEHVFVECGRRLSFSY